MYNYKDIIMHKQDNYSKPRIQLFSIIIAYTSASRLLLQTPNYSSPRLQSEQTLKTKYFCFALTKKILPSKKQKQQNTRTNLKKNYLPNKAF